MHHVLIRLVCLSAPIAQDSNDGKAADFAFPTTFCTPNWIYPRFDLILELNPIAAKVGGGFMPSTPDTAKCQVVPVTGCVELQSECMGCTLQGPTVDHSRSGDSAFLSGPLLAPRPSPFLRASSQQSGLKAAAVNCPNSEDDKRCKASQEDSKYHPIKSVRLLCLWRSAAQIR